MEESGSFVMDKFIGRDTDFSVFTLSHPDTYLKSFVVRDRRGGQFPGIQGTRAAFKILDPDPTLPDKFEAVSSQYSLSHEK